MKYINGRLHLFSIHRGGGEDIGNPRRGAIKSQKFQGEGVIKRQKSKGGPIKSLKFLGNSTGVW